MSSTSRRPRTRRAERDAGCSIGWVRPELQRAALLTSELVTNAVIHGEGKISVRAQLDQDRLLVEVIDQGHGFERVVTTGISRSSAAAG